MRSSLSLHVRAPLGAVRAQGVPGYPWTHLYQGLPEAGEDPRALRASLLDLSGLGPALAFPWPEGGRLRATRAQALSGRLGPPHAALGPYGLPEAEGGEGLPGEVVNG